MNNELERHDEGSSYYNFKPHNVQLIKYFYGLKQRKKLYVLRDLHTSKLSYLDYIIFIHFIIVYIINILCSYSNIIRNGSCWRET